MVDKPRDRLAEIFAIFVTLVWAGSALSGVATHEYEALQLITPVMLIVAGYVAGVKVIRNGKDK